MRIDNPAKPPGTRKQLEMRVAEFLAAYLAWNGGDDDELAEIAATTSLAWGARSTWTSIRKILRPWSGKWLERIET